MNYTALKQAVIIGNEIRCPICNKKFGEITGNVTIKNFKAQCARKIAGASHYFIINVEQGEK